MKHVTVTQLKSRLSAVLDEAGAEPLIVTKHGRPVAVLAGASQLSAVQRGLAFQAALNAPWGADGTYSTGVFVDDGWFYPFASAKEDIPN